MFLSEVCTETFIAWSYSELHVYFISVWFLWKFWSKSNHFWRRTTILRVLARVLSVNITHLRVHTLSIKSPLHILCCHISHKPCCTAVYNNKPSRYDLSLNENTFKNGTQVSSPNLWQSHSHLVVEHPFLIKSSAILHEINAVSYLVSSLSIDAQSACIPCILNSGMVLNLWVSSELIPSSVKAVHYGRVRPSAKQ
jgi:hypothetical protein